MVDVVLSGVVDVLRRCVEFGYIGEREHLSVREEQADFRCELDEVFNHWLDLSVDCLINKLLNLRCGL